MQLLTSLVHWSLSNRGTVLALALIFTVFGMYQIPKVKMDAVPDITTVQVQIITSVPSLSPVEIEKYITFPVERAMSGLPNLVETRSISRYGISMVTVVFRDDTSIQTARQYVQERINEAISQIPTGYAMPVMGPISTGLGEIFQFVLKSDRHNLKDLTTYLNWVIYPQLKTVPGIVEVNVFGGENKQFQIVADTKKMMSFGITASDIIDAIKKNNISSGGGYVEKNKEHTVIGTEGLLQGTVDIENISLQIKNSKIPIQLSSFAEIKEGFRLRRGAATKDGKGEVAGAITLMLMKENSLQVTEAVKIKISELNKFLPEGMEIIPFYDRSAMVKKTVKTVLLNLGEGALLVTGILFLMLGSLRAGLVIASAIPLAMLFTILIMNLTDMPGNLMSLGAIDFGLIVDGAVIIVENSVRRLHLKRMEKKEKLTEQERIDVIRDATIEVRKATIFGETIIAVVYLPVLTLQGIEGKMFIPMAKTVLFALTGALILSLTIIPVLASYVLNDQSEEEHETLLFRWLNRLYKPSFNWVIKNERKTIFATLFAFILSIFIFARMGGEFLPQLDEGSLLLEVNRLPSTSLTESVNTGLTIEKILLRKFPEITGVVSKTGSPELAIDPMGVDRSDVFLSLLPKSDWRFGKEELINQIKVEIEKKLPHIVFSVSQPIQMRTNELIAGIRSDVGIKIFGDDLKTLKKFGEEIAKILKSIDGARDIKIEQVEGLSYYRIRPMRDRMSRYGVNMEDINLAIEMTASGSMAGYLYEGPRRFEIALLGNKKNFTDPEFLKMLPVRRGPGQTIPLSDVAEIKKEEGPVQISHENQSRRLLVEFNVRGRDMLSAVNESEKKIRDAIQFPQGYRYEIGGKYQNYLTARNTLLIVIPATLGLILFILWTAFHKMTPALMIFLNVPFAVTGGIFTLFIRNIPFSISAGIGFIALFGVAVLNGLVLISFTQELVAQGKKQSEAVIEAAKIRFRPVMTTAIVAALGFLPMAFSTSMGAEVQRPLATVVIGGLITSSILTLLVLPVIYKIYYKKQELK